MYAFSIVRCGKDESVLFIEHLGDDESGDMVEDVVEAPRVEEPVNKRPRQAMKPCRFFLNTRTQQ
jgi:hypothetical protein